MSVVMVVNEKWRERVLAWTAFEALPDNFPFFFQRLMDACLSPLEVCIPQWYNRDDSVCTSLCCRTPSIP